MKAEETLARLGGNIQLVDYIEDPTKGQSICFVYQGTCSHVVGDIVITNGFPSSHTKGHSF